MKYFPAFTFLLATSIVGCVRQQPEGLPSAKPEPIATSKLTFNVMAPLVVAGGTPKSAANAKEWDEFAAQLAAIKALGADGVSTDVWWGMVEPQDQNFQWGYYDTLADHIAAAGLKWVPILSFHQCGGNVGDTCDVTVPAWVWDKLAKQSGRPVRDLQYVSEQGNASREYVSAWATPMVLPDYRELMTAFRDHYASRAGSISEVNVSLGPAGELRYPSYNSHDKGTGYPTRGGLQSYSSLAVEAFRAAAFKKYGSLSKIKAAWSPTLNVTQPADIMPPFKPSEFFAKGHHLTTQYGRDFIDFYSDSLLQHGQQLLALAVEVFVMPPSPMAGVDLGAKVPGIHWRMGTIKDGNVVLSDRQAEIAAGLIRTSKNDWAKDEDGRGYRDIIAVMAAAQKSMPAGKLVLHFTCLEMPDGDGAQEVQSLARSLVRWVGDEATRQGLTLKGENALGWNVPKPQSWDLMAGSLEPIGSYDGLTILRMTDILASDVARKRFAALAR